MKLIAMAVAASVGVAAPSVKDVRRDCAAHGGALTRAYSAKTLRQAARRYPGCAVGIRSQLAGRVGKRGGSRQAACLRDYTLCRAALRSQLSLFGRR
jgi:hypothetical protein